MGQVRDTLVSNQIVSEHFKGWKAYENASKVEISCWMNSHSNGIAVSDRSLPLSGCWAYFFTWRRHLPQYLTWTFTVTSTSTQKFLWMCDEPQSHEQAQTHLKSARIYQLTFRGNLSLITVVITTQDLWKRILKSVYSIVKLLRDWWQIDRFCPLLKVIKNRPFLWDLANLTNSGGSLLSVMRR